MATLETIGIDTNYAPVHQPRTWRLQPAATLLLLAVTLVLSHAGQAVAGPANRFCSTTTAHLADACRNEVRDDYQVALVSCVNESDAQDRSECLEDARDSRDEGEDLCREQRAARLGVCKLVGESRHDPDFDEALFDDDFTNLTSPNLYFPLDIGNTWEYQGDETVNIEVLDATKLIDDVTCLVVRDQVTDAGNLVEDTDDWYAHAKNGDVYYCGEEVKDFETFPGDNPPNPELVSIDGSFKAGRDGAKAGIRFLGAPAAGDVYRQEFLPGTAEDLAQVLTTTYDFGDNPELDEFVPEALADLLCSSNCIVTKDFTPLEPDVFELKYYAPHIGTFFEVKHPDGTFLQLVDCNFDAKCALLPPL